MNEKFLSRLNIKQQIVTGKRVYFEIINYSNKIKADIIIMGTKGSSGIKGIFFGSNAERSGLRAVNTLGSNTSKLAFIPSSACK